MLLMLHTSVQRDQDVEIVRRCPKQVSVLQAVPAAFSHRLYGESRIERIFQTPVEILIQ